ncbi:hypothetical protein D3C80_1072920 [compost metagenome]
MLKEAKTMWGVSRGAPRSSPCAGGILRGLSASALATPARGKSEMNGTNRAPWDASTNMPTVEAPAC